MDSNFLAAILGLLGGLFGALVGGFYTLRAATRQIDIMLMQIRGDVNERLFNQNQTILEFLGNHPHLRPYLYDNKPINDCPDDEGRDQIRLVAEMATGFLEIIAVSILEMPVHDKQLWKQYIVDIYRTSPAIREHLDESRDWYSPELHDIFREFDLLPKN